MPDMRELFDQYIDALNRKNEADRAFEDARQRLSDALQADPVAQAVVQPPKTWTVPSRAHEHIRYTVTEYPDGRRTCTCPGYTFRKACRHTDKFMAILDARSRS